MDASAKQQVVERLKQAQNILITVSTNPNIDQLAACIGLTLLLNKTGKHSTAVFSGAIPSILEFLQPEKTLESTTDSLRDFIISLDKEKADKLRYKVEDDVVKIFITPYRTSISEKDLVFSQGDFNVEAVVALGVKDKTQLDAAITAHGRILHDATVIGVNAGKVKSAGIGQINWLDETASSLSEMIVSISEALGSNLIDNQMATAFLTGIVAETDRFSNPKTSPKVMTMSAQLMAAGANQQLIVSKLETALEVPAKQAAPVANTVPPVATAKSDGTLSVKHTEESKLQAEIAIEPKKDSPTAEATLPPLNLQDKEITHEINIDNEGNIHLKDGETATTPVVAPNEEAKPPSMPGSHQLLNPNNSRPVLESPFTASTEPDWDDTGSNGSTDPFSDNNNSGLLTHAPTVNPLDSKSDINLDALGTGTGAPHVEKARNAVESAFAAAPYSPANNPVDSLNAAPLEPIQSAPPEQKPEVPDSPAPPPVPPPLMPSPGIVIPPKPYSNAQNIDNNTL